MPKFNKILYRLLRFVLTIMLVIITFFNVTYGFQLSRHETNVFIGTTEATTKPPTTTPPTTTLPTTTQPTTAPPTTKPPTTTPPTTAPPTTKPTTGKPTEPVFTNPPTNPATTTSVSATEPTEPTISSEKPTEPEEDISDHKPPGDEQKITDPETTTYPTEGTIETPEITTAPATTGNDYRPPNGKIPQTDDVDSDPRLWLTVMAISVSILRYTLFFEKNQ